METVNEEVDFDAIDHAEMGVALAEEDPKAFALSVEPVASEQLLAALYFIWDAAERGQLQVFLIKDTAKQVIAQEDLSGDKITVGVRRNEWDSGQGRIAQTFLEHELNAKAVEKDGEVIYDCHGVPIIIKLYEDNPCLNSFDMVFYKYETFHLPNPYKEFVEKYE